MQPKTWVTLFLLRPQRDNGAEAVGRSPTIWASIKIPISISPKNTRRSPCAKSISPSIYKHVRIVGTWLLQRIQDESRSDKKSATHLAMELTRGFARARDIKIEPKIKSLWWCLSLYSLRKYFIARPSTLPSYCIDFDSTLEAPPREFFLPMPCILYAETFFIDIQFRMHTPKN